MWDTMFEPTADNRTRDHSLKLKKNRNPVSSGFAKVLFSERIVKYAVSHNKEQIYFWRNCYIYGQFFIIFARMKIRIYTPEPHVIYCLIERMLQ